MSDMDTKIYTLATNDALSIKNVRFYKGKSYFTIVDDITEVHGCTVKESSDGFPFVSFPSYTGNDDRWYKHAYVDLSDDETDEIADIIAKLAAESEADEQDNGGRSRRSNRGDDQRGGGRRNNQSGGRRSNNQSIDEDSQSTKDESTKGGRRRNAK